MSRWSAGLTACRARSQRRSGSRSPCCASLLMSGARGQRHLKGDAHLDRFAVKFATVGASRNPAGRASGVFGSASGSASLLLACSAALEQDAQPFLTGRDGPAGHLAERRCNLPKSRHDAYQNDREHKESPPYPRAILLNVLACVPLRE